MAAIQPNDVLFGRGGATNQHVGNKRFRNIVAEHMPEYLKAPKKEKADIARRIVSQIKNDGGRFLKRGGPGSEAWVQVLDRKAREKTSQALREGLDVRHRTFRLDKMPRRDSDSSGGNNRTRPRVMTGRVLEIPLVASTSSSSESMGQVGGGYISDAAPDLQDEGESSARGFAPKSADARKLEGLMKHFEPPRFSKADCSDVAEI